MLINQKGITYIRSSFPQTGEEVVHAFLTRKGGSSRGPFSSLNLSMDVGDDPESVEGNRNLVKEALGIKRFFTLRQVHGYDIVTVANKGLLPDEPPEADGAVTNIPGLALSLLTADCLPVLLYDPVKRVAGAVHAGWRGTLKGISKRAVQRMTGGFGSRPEDILAVFGPCIGPCCYTVGEDLYIEFKKVFGKGHKFFKEEEGTLRLDLGAANAVVLKAAGLPKENIMMENPCTSCLDEFFFSHRRDRRTGRQMSFIMIRG